MPVITQKVHMVLFSAYESICLIYPAPSYSKCLIYFKDTFPMTDTAGTKNRRGHNLTQQRELLFPFMCHSIILFSGFTFTVGEIISYGMYLGKSDNFLYLRTG